MIYREGNVLAKNTTEQEVIVCHQVNCKGVMGAGLALQVKNLYPGVFDAYRDKCELIKEGIGGLGDVQFCSVLDEAGYIIANIFGQDGYGRYKQQTDYAALEKAFITIGNSFPNAIIRFPYEMGCGLGGGSWRVVSALIERHLTQRGVAVEIIVPSRKWEEVKNSVPGEMIR